MQQYTAMNAIITFNVNNKLKNTALIFNMQPSNGKLCASISSSKVQFATIPFNIQHGVSMYNNNHQNAEMSFLFQDFNIIDIGQQKDTTVLFAFLSEICKVEGCPMKDFFVFKVLSLVWKAQKCMHDAFNDLLADFGELSAEVEDVEETALLSDSKIAFLLATLTPYCMIGWRLLKLKLLKKETSLTCCVLC